MPSRHRLTISPYDAAVLDASAPATNRFASTCSCSGVAASEDLISYDEQNPWNADATTCNSNFSANSCTGSCEQVINNCGTLIAVLPNLMDLDTGDTGAMEAMTVGLRFTAAGAYVESASN